MTLVEFMKEFGPDCGEDTALRDEMRAALEDLISSECSIERARCRKQEVEPFMAALQETWCASTDDDHAIGDNSKEAKRCPVCADARSSLITAQCQRKDNA